MTRADCITAAYDAAGGLTLPLVASVDVDDVRAVWAGYVVWLLLYSIPGEA